MKFAHIPLLGTLLWLSLPALAAKLPGFEMMPDETRYIECSGPSCNSAELESLAIEDSYSRGGSGQIRRFTYMLGDMAAERVYAVTVWVYAGNPREGEPGYVEIRPTSIPSSYINEFNSYVSIVKNGIGVVDIPPEIAPTFATDAGTLANIGSYLRGRPWASNLWVMLRRPIVTVRFSNGWTAKFLYKAPLSTDPFQYVPRTLKDADGNTVPDGSEPQSSNEVGSEYAGGGTSSSNYFSIRPVFAALNAGTVSCKWDAVSWTLTCKVRAS